MLILSLSQINGDISFHTHKNCFHETTPRLPSIFLSKQNANLNHTNFVGFIWKISPNDKPFAYLKKKKNLGRSLKFNCNIYSIVISFHKSVTTCSKSDYLFVNQQLNYVSFSDKCAPAHTKKIHAKSCKIVPSMIKTILRYLGFK